MENKVLFRGIFPALATPLDNQGGVCADAVRPMMEWMIREGVHGFYILGGTGEGAVLPEKERIRMAEAAADVLRNTGRKLIIHVGAADMACAERLARHAAGVHADAISSVYPNFFCKYTIEEAVDYYKALIDISGLPMLCYCTPVIQENSILPFVERLMKIDGMIGVKYTFPNYYHLFNIKKINHGNINVINGPDETLICGLCMGADGGIGSTYNLIPDWYVNLFDSFMKNDLEAARNDQNRINEIIAVCLKFGLIPTIKYGLELLGFNPGNAALPGHRFQDEERVEIKKAFLDAGLVF